MTRPDRRTFCFRWPIAIGLLGLHLLVACGGGSSGGSIGGGSGGGNTLPSSGQTITDPMTGNPGSPSPPGQVVLPRPVLSFNDTGVSVSDGVTFNGRWSVGSLFDGLGWEWSLDEGRTWIRGEGDSFLVAGDGPKTIWARTFDGQGNFSEIVMVACTLDTTLPMQPQVSVISGALPAIRIEGLEPLAGWEYSLNEQRSWIRASGQSLSFAGNHLRRIWSRQVDAAGNVSAAVSTMLDHPTAASGWVEASNEAMQPTALPRWEGTLLLHGEVLRGDADFVRFDVPSGYRLSAMRLVYYDSTDPIAFYALQKSPVFDAGTNVQRMLSWKHLGPPDLMLELLGAIPQAERGAGAYTLWIQQTGTERTAYAVEIVINPE
jgi:hypothetical protein